MSTRQRAKLAMTEETNREGSRTMSVESSKERFTWSRKTKALAAGLLVAAMMAASVTAGAPAHASNIHTVNVNGDQPDTNPGDGFCNADISPGVQGCTLRAAIQESNENPGADRINFNLPFASIQPRSPLPFIRNQTTIDGYTQPGASPNTLQAGDNAVIRVELDGTFAGNASGLEFFRTVSGDNPSNSVVQGLAINNFAGDGVSVFGGLGIRIEGNFIGTDTSGTNDRGNGASGVTIREGSGDDIGGAHIVGDGTPASRNVISGNGSDGVRILFGPSNNKVKGNYIGTDKDGTDNLTNDDMGNDGSGVAIFEANDNEVGGSTAGTGNVISNNDSNGVSINKSTGNKVLGNRIGTDRTGKKDLGNFGDGVFVSDAANNTIGDGTSGGANTIAFSDRTGVNITEGGDSIPNNTNGNRILSNSIFSNGDFFPGIALNSGGLPNDPGDADTGANGLQNKPVITSAKSTSTKTTVKGKLNSTPAKTFKIQFFSNPKGTDEGKKFIGQKNVTTGASGNVSFTKALPRVAFGKTITATVTGSEGTSEFSAPRKVVSS
jgi:hypothetical protein